MNIWKFGPMPFFEKDGGGGTGTDDDAGGSDVFDPAAVADVLGLADGLDDDDQDTDDTDDDEDDDDDDDGGGDDDTDDTDDTDDDGDKSGKKKADKKAEDDQDTDDTDDDEDDDDEGHWSDEIGDKAIKKIAAKFETREAFLKDALGLDPSVDWRAGIKDRDLKKMARRFSSVNDLVKAVDEGHKRQSRSLIFPSKDAPKKEKLEFVNKVGRMLGVPENPEDYGFVAPAEGEKLTEDQKTQRTMWSEFFHGLNVPKGSADAIVAKFQEEKERGLEVQEQEDTAFAEDTERELKEEWGKDHKQNLALAAHGAERLFGEDLVDMAKTTMENGRLLMDSPVMLRALAKVGREMAEGSMDVLTDTERETLQDQIKDAREKADKASASGKSAEADRFFKKEQELISRLQGKQPIVGAEGRSA